MKVSSMLLARSLGIINYAAVMRRSSGNDRHRLPCALRVANVNHCFQLQQKKRRGNDSSMNYLQHFKMSGTNEYEKKDLAMIQQQQIQQAELDAFYIRLETVGVSTDVEQLNGLAQDVTNALARASSRDNVERNSLQTVLLSSLQELSTMIGDLQSLNARLEQLSNDKERLEQLKNDASVVADKWKQVNPLFYLPFYGFASCVNGALKNFVVSEKTFVSRFVDVDFEIANTATTGTSITGNLSLLSTFDLDALYEKVMSLFSWYTNENEKKTYMAPYFPIVQSSGMGKTKLMYELKDQYSCETIVHKLILCTDGVRDTPPDTAVFDNVLLVKSSSTTNDRDELLFFLNELIKKTDTTTTKFVLMFDEAQHLTRENGWAFRVVRWWLRESRAKLQIVILFAGTTSSLANFYNEAPQSSTSRSDATYVKSGTQLHSPFFDFWTVGCLAMQDFPLNDQSSEYDDAIRFGRPLFAKVFQKGLLNDDAHASILRKMLLGDDANSWTKNNKACLSILATRVQMGQTQVGVTSELVAKGYAGLTLFEHGSYGTNHASMCHFRDPVCARLAMCLMDGNETWENYCYTSRDKTFWSIKAMELFSSQLCYPSTGDVGEVFVALYLLFCGDILRARDDPSYTTFSVKLADWLDMLASGMHDSSIPVAAEKKRMSHPQNCHNVLAGEISFIQVCRNHLRFDMIKLLDKDILKDMYEAGTAYYVYQDCPTIDMFAAIRIPGDNGSYTYAPLLVSVKSLRNGMGDSDIEENFVKMENILKTANYENGCCLLVLLGSSTTVAAPDVNISDSNSKDLKCEPVEQDATEPNLKTKTLAPTAGTSNRANSIERRFVAIPMDDPFGISEAFARSTSERRELAELSASHELLHSYCQHKAKGSSCLDATALRRSLRRASRDPPLHRLKKFETSLDASFSTKD